MSTCCDSCSFKNLIDALDLPTPPNLLDPHSKNPTLSAEEFHRQLADLKWIIWTKEQDGDWQEHEDGPFTSKQAETIAEELRRDATLTVRILPEFEVPA